MKSALAEAIDFLNLKNSKISSMVIGLDPSFSRTLPLPSVRDYILNTHGIDIGFDLGPDTFSLIFLIQFLDRFKNAHFYKSIPSQLIQNLSLQLKACSWNGRFRFFIEKNGFAADTDCTGLAGSILNEAGFLSQEELLEIGRQLLASSALEEGDLKKGVNLVYWDDGQEPSVLLRGKKQDPVVSVNALYTLKLAQEVGLLDPTEVILQTENFVFSHLVSGSFLRGTRYYPYPDSFLYFVSRLCKRFKECFRRFKDPLSQALDLCNHEMMNPELSSYSFLPLNLAFRILASQNIGRSDVLKQKQALLVQQLPNGSWNACPFFTLGRFPYFFGSETLTTLFAVQALAEPHTVPTDHYDKF